MQPKIESVPNKYFNASNLDGSTETCKKVGQAMRDWLKDCSRHHNKPAKKKSRRQQIKDTLHLLDNGYSVGRWLHYNHGDVGKEYDEGTVCFCINLRLIRDLINRGIIEEESRKQIQEFTWIQYRTL